MILQVARYVRVSPWGRESNRSSANRWLRELKHYVVSSILDAYS